MSEFDIKRATETIVRAYRGDREKALLGVEQTRIILEADHGTPGEVSPEGMAQVQAMVEYMVRDWQLWRLQDQPEYEVVNGRLMTRRPFASGWVPAV
jgi:hypothetical protein